MSTNQVHVVVDIGCLECGEATELLGLFATDREAQAAISKRAVNEHGSYFAGGQRSVEAFAVEVLA